METVQLTEWTSRECRDYLLGGGDLAFVPVASVERLGPHLPLGGRLKLASVLADALARRHGGVCLPAVPFATTLETDGTPGTISVEAQAAERYLWEICEELVTGGFRRVVYVGWQSELYYVVAEYFQQHDVSPSWIIPDRIRLPGVEDADVCRTALIAAAYRIDGNEAMVDEIARRSREGAGRTDVPEYLARIREVGVLGYRNEIDEWTISPVPEVPVDAAAAALTGWVDDLEDGLAALGEYNGAIARSRFDRGLR